MTEYKASLMDVVVAVIALVNFLVFVYAVYRLFIDYSEVRYMYLMISLLFAVVAVLFNDMKRKFDAVIMHIGSVLLALKVIF